jgi:transcriptional regulator with XRE-family HTH domain
MTEPKPKKPKFKDTRELVKIAIADGMTQKQIADVCRVEQSVVSGWLNGKSLAFDHQIAELKRRYGNRLNRTTSRVYLTLNNAPSTSRWEDTDRARRLLTVREELRKLDEEARARVETEEQEDAPPRTTRTRRSRAPRVVDEEEAKARDALDKETQKLLEEIRPGAPHFISLTDLIESDQEDFETARNTEREQLTQVQGPIVLRYTFVAHKPNRRRDEIERVRVPVARWLVHHQSNGKFVLVRQERRMLEGQALWQWKRTLLASYKHQFGASHSSAEEFTNKETKAPYVECADDSARWLSFIEGPMDAAALREYCDAYIQDPTMHHDPHDERTLPFLLRKVLVEHGHDVPGLVRIIDSE